MLSRLPSTVSVLERPKSTSPPKKICMNRQYAGFPNKDAAQNNAVTAAELAFHRATESATTEIVDLGQRQGLPQIDAPVGTLDRRRSVRFAGPSAIPLRQHSIMRHDLPDQSVPARKRSQSSGYKHDEGGIDVTPELVEHPKSLKRLHASSSDVRSQAASQPRLRRAKSMFSTSRSSASRAGRHLQRQSLRSSDDSWESAPTQAHISRVTHTEHRDLISPSTLHSRESSTNDQAIQMARDEYLRQIQQQRLRSRPSVLGLIKMKRSHRYSITPVEKKHVGESQEYANETSEPFHEAGHISFRNRARNFSRSLKARVKQAFRKSSTTPSDVPFQHLQATHAHFNRRTSDSRPPSLEYPLVPSPDAELLRRAGSRELIERDRSTSYEGISPAEGLITSSSQEYPSSRVTSWANSTIIHPMPSMTHLARQRLSVIKEDGDSFQASSSVGLKSSIPHHDNFLDPLGQSLSTSGVEPQRVFSALQKEIIKRSSQHDAEKMHEEIWQDQKPEDRYRKSPLVRFSSVDKKSHEMMPSSDSSTRSASLKDQELDLTETHIQSSGANGPLYETGSVLFPTSMRIERVKGASPYRKARQGVLAGRVNPSMDPLHNAIESEEPPGIITTIRGDTFGVEPKNSYSNKRSLQSTVTHAFSSPSNNSRSSKNTWILPMEEDNELMEGDDTLPDQLRQVSYQSRRSSFEWKSILASEADRHDNNDTVQKSLSPELESQKGRGHRRESAQLWDNPESLYSQNVEQSDREAAKTDKVEIQTKRPTSKETRDSHNSGRRPLLDITLANGTQRCNPKTTSTHARDDVTERSSTNVSTNVSKRGPDRLYEHSQESPEDFSQRSISTGLSTRHVVPMHRQRISRLNSKSLASLPQNVDVSERRFAENEPSMGMPGKLGLGNDYSPHPEGRERWARGPGATIPKPKSPFDKEQLVESFLRDKRRENVRVSESSLATAFL